MQSANRQAIESMAIFDDLPHGFSQSILSQLKPLFHLKGDFIAKQGEIGTEMFFLCKGTVHVYCTVEGIYVYIYIHICMYIYMNG